MARTPLTKEEVMPAKIVLNLKEVGISEDQFFQLCGDNSDLFMELTAQKELVIMSPNGLKSGWRDTMLATELMIWARKDGTGIAFGPSAGYTLPNGAVRGPDASWIRRHRLSVFTDEELEKFAHICPDFAAEIASPSNTVAELKVKMEEYLANGAQLGWLIDPYHTRVYIYRSGKAVDVLENPTMISGDPVLNGFTFNVAEIW